MSAALRRTNLARLVSTEPIRYLAEVVKDASLRSDEATLSRAIETLSVTDPQTAIKWVETNMTGAQLVKKISAQSTCCTPLRSLLGGRRWIRALSLLPGSIQSGTGRLAVGALQVEVFAFQQME